MFSQSLSSKIRSLNLLKKSSFKNEKEKVFDVLENRCQKFNRLNSDFVFTIDGHLNDSILKENVFVPKTKIFSFSFFFYFESIGEQFQFTNEIRR